MKPVASIYWDEISAEGLFCELVSMYHRKSKFHPEDIQNIRCIVDKMIITGIENLTIMQKTLAVLDNTGITQLPCDGDSGQEAA